MTYKERLALEHPSNIDPELYGGCCGCPAQYGYCKEDEELCALKNGKAPEICEECWNREMPEKEKHMKFKVGDRVKVREWDDMKKEFGLDNDGDIACGISFVMEMKEFCGKTMTVVNVCEDGKQSYFLRGGDGWKFSDDMLEEAPKELGNKIGRYWRNITNIYKKQTEKGLKEYGQTLEENHDLSTEEMITMAEEELVDLACYLEKLKEMLNGKTDSE